MVVEQLVSLDINKKSLIVYAKQADHKGRVLRIQLMDYNKKIEVPAGVTVTLRALKPDGTSVINNGSRNSDGTVSVELTDQVLAVEGMTLADVSIAQSGVIVSSATFVIKVGPVPVGSGVASSNEFLQLEALMAQATQLITNYVSTGPQELSDAQKAQVRQNIGVKDYDDTEIKKEIKETNENIAQLSDSMTEITFHNYADNSKFLKGKYFNDKGVLTDNANSRYMTEYIPVDAKNTYKRTAVDATVQIVGYDDSKKLIQRLYNGSTTVYNFGEDVKYIRISIYGISDSEFSDLFVFSTSEDFPYLVESGTSFLDGRKLGDGSVTSNKIENSAVSEEKTSFFSASKNIFDKTACVKDKFIDSGNGVVTQATSEVSGKIIVSAGDVLHFQATSGLYIAKYETNNTYVRTSLSSTATTFTATTDGYVRFARYHQYFPDEFMVSINSELPSTYEEYGAYTFDYADDSGKEALEAVNSVKYAGYINKTATQINIYNGNVKYVVNKYNRTDIRANLWRTNNCYYRDNNEEVRIWYDSDSDGVVHLANEADFLGGYHGDEITTSFHLFIDGVEYAEDSVFQKKYFEELVIVCESDIYHCNTSAQSENICFKRNKVLMYNKNGMTVKNYWVAQEDVTVTLAYFGMLSIERFVNNSSTDLLLNGYETNKDYKYYDNSVGASASKDMTEATMHTKYGDFCISSKDMNKSEHYSGSVANYNGSGGKRLKVYIGPIHDDTPVQIHAGDILRGEATYSYNG